jgi:hypothetical protein
MGDVVALNGHQLAREDELLTALIDALRWSGWSVHHDRRSDVALTQGDPGLPDIIAVDRAGRMLAWEAKSTVGRTTDAQRTWLDRLERVPGVDARVIRPVDLGTALGVITSPPPPKCIVCGRAPVRMFSDLAGLGVCRDHA